MLTITKEELDKLNSLCIEADSKKGVVVAMTPVGHQIAPLKEDWDEVNDYIAQLGIKHGFDSSTQSIDLKTGEIIPRW